jgi:hypothetical protein
LPKRVGPWTSDADSKTSVDQLSCDQNVRLATNPTEGLAKLREMVQPLQLQHSRAEVHPPDTDALAAGKSTLSISISPMP